MEDSDEYEARDYGEDKVVITAFHPYDAETTNTAREDHYLATRP
jgi:hypothetical protein